MARIGVACTGLGRVHRGYEAFAAGLFTALRSHTEMVLLKGGGTSRTGEFVVPNLPRSTSLRWGLTGDSIQAHRWEQQSFAVGAVPIIAGQRVRIVHYQDAALTGALIRLRRWLGLRFTLLFANGGAHTPEHYARADAIQVLTRQQYDEAMAYGIEPDRVFHIPHGVSCTHFARPTEYDRELGRAAHGIPVSAWVVLGVTALAMSEKRADWLVREVARLDVPNAFLLLAGQEGPETEKLRELAATLLPGRHAFTTVAPDRVRELYWLADVMALPSLREGFGLAAIEAAAAGTPVLVHDGPHFRGLLEHDASFVDMSAAGALSARLSELRAAPERSRAVADANRAIVHERFDWSVLAPAYVTMYEAVGAMKNTMSVALNDATSRRTR